MASDPTGSRAPALGHAQSAALQWIEPVVVVGAMLTALVVSRRRNYNIIPSKDEALRRQRSPDGSSRNSEDNLIDSDDREYLSESDSSLLPRSSSHRNPSLSRQAEPSGIYTHHIHSRILQKFPFLIEMFYWALNYAAYQISKESAAWFHGQGGNANVQLAQDHGIQILNFEHESIFSFFFAIKEITVQKFFLSEHVGIMSILNQIYSLVHIPGTVTFICWYYYAAPNFNQFAIARRTMSLANMTAFAVFTFYPCMPPRLLPERFGFEDTVRQAHAESVWVGENGEGTHFNQLAAMPSLHFTYALIIGSALFWHSGFLQSISRKRRERNFFTMLIFMLAGLCYPALVLLVIVATANHYYLDAVAAFFSTIFCFTCNKIWLIFLPAEALLGRIIQVDKPVPTTGDARRTRRSRISKERVKEVSTFA